MLREATEHSLALEAATALSVQKQINTLISLHFDEELGMDEAAYMESFGGFSSMIPPSGMDASGAPILVDSRISNVKQASLAGIKDFFHAQDMQAEVASGSPYLIWVPNYGDQSLTSSSGVFRLQQEEEALTEAYEAPELVEANLLELLSLAIQRKDLVTGKRLVAGAAVPDNGNLPYLNASTDSFWIGSVYKPNVGKFIYRPPAVWGRGSDEEFEPLWVARA